MSFKPLVIASRQSPLAVRQAQLVRERLGKVLNVDLEDLETAFPLKTYVSTGDKLMTPSLAEIGGKGLFTKEVEDALLSGEADIAVHSMKDMPAVMPEGLVLAATPPRDDPRDALVTSDGLALDDVPAGARVGTSSIRRRAQLARLRPDLELVPMRGNVGTRLQKLAVGEADATFLAEAGLQRLQRDDVRRRPMEVDAMLPAPGQGILCTQTRTGDNRALEACALINCPDTALASAAERAIVQSLDASCRTPLAAFAEVREGEVDLRAEILTPDGSLAIAGNRQALEASAMRAAEMGRDLAAQLADEAGTDLARIFGAL